MEKETVLLHFGNCFTSYYEKYFGPLKVKGHQVLTLCTFHPDKNPSLSIDTETGRFNCFGCGASGDIFTFYKLRHNLNGDFPAVVEGIARDFGISEPAEAGKRKKQRGRIVATYDYTNAAGELLFQVVKDEFKNFWQRKPDARGGWINSIEGIERPLYRLPEVLQAQTVNIPEGEKDCETLRALGYTATTNPHGAGNWRVEHSEPLAGKDIIIFADNDEAGRKHAEQVARSLYGKARSLKVVEPPGLTPKGDISDFLAQFTDPDEARERLRIIIEGTAPYRPPTKTFSGDQQQAEPKTDQRARTPRPAAVGWCAADLMATEFPEPRWAVPGIIPEGLTLLAGKPKRGKSILAMNLAIAISSGGKALGWSQVDPGGVLCLFLEDNPRRLKGRLSTMLCGGPASPRLWLYTQWPRMNEGGLDLLAADIESHENLRLIIIDTLPKFRPPKPRGADPYQWDYETGTQIKAFADSAGVAVLVICHLRKTESDDRLDDISGTFGVTGSADGTLVLVRNTGQADGTLIVSGRDVEEAELALRFDPGFLSWNIIGNASEIKSTEMKQRLYDAMREYNGAFSPRQMANFSGLSENYIKRMLPYFERENGLRKLSRGRYELSPLNIL